MRIIKFLMFFPCILGFSCASDDGKTEPVSQITSFSGSIIYESNDEPVTSGELFIMVTDSEPLRSPIVRAEAILTIEDGSFEVSFETFEEVDKFSMFVNILEGSSIINTFVGGGADNLQCLPGNCAEFAPGRSYNLTIIVPCAPDDCTQFPVSN